MSIFETGAEQSFPPEEGDLGISQVEFADYFQPGSGHSTVDIMRGVSTYLSVEVPLNFKSAAINMSRLVLPSFITRRQAERIQSERIVNKAVEVHDRPGIDVFRFGDHDRAIDVVVGRPASTAQGNIVALMTEPNRQNHTEVVTFPGVSQERFTARQYSVDNRHASESVLTGKERVYDDGIRAVRLVGSNYSTRNLRLTETAVIADLIDDLEPANPEVVDSPHTVYTLGAFASSLGFRRPIGHYKVGADT